MGTSETKINLENLKAMFLTANRSFIENHARLLKRELSERCLCGALMYELNKQLEKKNLKKYYADIEFNRDEDNVKRISCKSDDGVYSKRIFTDIIVHSRGEVSLDNLIALEMKKSSASQEEIDDDKARLKHLTKMNTNTSFGSYEYILGSYYEINLDKEEIKIEFFYNGNRKGQLFMCKY